MCIGLAASAIYDELKAEVFKAMEERMDQMKIVWPAPKGFTTTAQLWQRGVIEDESIALEDRDFSDFLLSLAAPLVAAPMWLCGGPVPECLGRFVAKERTAEKEVTKREGDGTVTVEGTQAHFTRAMESILETLGPESGASTMCAKFHTKGEAGNSYLQQTTPVQLNCIPDAVTHRTTKFLRCKLDAVFYDHRTIRSTSRIVMFGNLKGHWGDYFSDAEKGEIVDLAMDFLLNVQPERDFIIVFLTNTRGFQFFEVMRSPTAVCGFVTMESEFYDGVTADQLGWQVSGALACVAFCYY